MTSYCSISTIFDKITSALLVTLVASSDVDVAGPVVVEVAVVVVVPVGKVSLLSNLFNSVAFDS